MCVAEAREMEERTGGNVATIGYFPIRGTRAALPAAQLWLISPAAKRETKAEKLRCELDYLCSMEHRSVVSFLSSPR